VAARPEERNAILEALREPLDSLGLTVRALRNDDSPPPFVSAAPGTRARVWIDARPVDHVDIFVWTSSLGAPPAPARRVIPRSGSSAVVAEEVAYVVRSTLESLLQEPVASAAPPPAVIVAPPVARPVDALPVVPISPPPAGKMPGRFGFDAAAFATAQGFASSTAAFGGGLGMDLAFWGARLFRPTVWIGASLNAPFESVGTEATLETTLYSVRAIPGVELLQFGYFHVAAGAGFGVDFLRTVPGPGSASSTVTLSSPSTQADPVLEAQLLIHAPLGRIAGIVLGVNLDYDAAPHDYLQTGPSGASPVLAPWRVRPSAILGLCLPLVGESACAGSP
jgi:hypothetical protein